MNNKWNQENEGIADKKKKKKIYSKIEIKNMKKN